MVNEVLLIVYSTIGGPIQGLPSLSERLKRMSSVLLDGMHRPSVHCFLIPLKSTICIQTNMLFTVYFTWNRSSSQNSPLPSVCRNFNLEEALEAVSSQIGCEINKSLTERSYPALTPALQATLRGQICSITQKDNPIRTLVGKIFTSQYPKSYVVLFGIFFFDQGLFFYCIIYKILYNTHSILYVI